MVGTEELFKGNQKEALDIIFLKGKENTHKNQLNNVIICAKKLA